MPKPPQSQRDDPHNAQGAIPFSGDPPAEGPSAKFLQHDPPVDQFFPQDMGLQPNKFPRDSGFDTYTDIPGDGVVPG